MESLPEDSLAISTVNMKTVQNKNSKNKSCFDSTICF